MAVNLEVAKQGLSFVNKKRGGCSFAVGTQLRESVPPPPPGSRGEGVSYNGVVLGVNPVNNARPGPQS